MSLSLPLNTTEPYVVPEKVESKLWRYMDLTKFVALLDDQALFLPKATLMEDGFEGSFSQATLTARAAFFAENPVHDVAAYMEAQRKTFEDMREHMHLSCWHVNELESAAMWKLYSQGGNGIALVTSYGALRECLQVHEPYLRFGLVQYMDYETDPEPMADLNGYFPYFYKRRSFEYEHEFRVVLWDGVEEFHNRTGELAQETKAGIQLQVDLNTLIEEVRVSPKSPPWILKGVQSLVKRYGLGTEVKQSRLDCLPLY